MSNNPYYQAAELTTWQWKYVGGGGEQMYYDMSQHLQTQEVLKMLMTIA